MIRNHIPFSDIRILIHPSSFKKLLILHRTGSYKSVFIPFAESSFVIIFSVRTFCIDIGITHLENGLEGFSILHPEVKYRIYPFFLWIFRIFRMCFIPDIMPFLFDFFEIFYDLRIVRSPSYFFNGHSYDTSIGVDKSHLISEFECMTCSETDSFRVESPSKLRSHIFWSIRHEYREWHCIEFYGTSIFRMEPIDTSHHFPPFTHISLRESILVHLFDIGTLIDFEVSFFFTSFHSFIDSPRKFWCDICRNT